MVFKLAMLRVSLLTIIVVIITSSAAAAAAQDENPSFIYNGFRSANLSLDGIAQFTPNGLLKLTNETKRQIGHAFYPEPMPFKNKNSNSSTANGTVFSFSTTFVFSILSEYQSQSGHGIAFVIASTRGLPGARPSQYLGLFNDTNLGNETNHVFAVELDTIKSHGFLDINDNHVGIDINSLKSESSAPAGYYGDHFVSLTLISGRPMQRTNVTLAPINIPRPRSLNTMSLSRDLSSVLNDAMYVGFSSSTGSVLASHYILGWSFKINGQAEELNLSQLPKLPRVGPKKRSKFLTIGLPVICVSVIFAAVSGVVYVIRMKRKFAEELEDWELDHGPHRFRYKDLYIATKGFREKELLGTGGFGRVYRGTLPKSQIEIAVKKISHESRQGMKEFVAEIVSIGRLRHRNLVQLLGYCRRKGELLLVYDYMPNGSLDKYLYDQPKVTLNWIQRFRVIKGVALGLFYLHQEWEQVVIHRDVKASNVLLDGELNGRLGDFGLARLYDHGTDPQTTHVVGTLGYLAPEHTRTGKATTSADVFSFGAFLLEVACGRRPIQRQGPSENLILVDWVFDFWNRGELLEARDPNLGTEYVAEELELVLKLGLLCSHSDPTARPSMRQVVQILERDVALPAISALRLSTSGITYLEGFDDFAVSNPPSMGFTRPSSVAESLLSGGR
ncbi:L-type lectin-domain containing receptor kinase IV.4 [Citrus sinensis]|uniref:L-type lectin-domain containing receptor kinase IV.4 n=1 Tax=Citrus sinensis TaxID=2711 RepID=A0ACB8JUB7_CITSI|nr:L-type lectin-domain containing receptor kinase IV.4 [Citrus sinensis]